MKPRLAVLVTTLITAASSLAVAQPRGPWSGPRWQPGQPVLVADRSPVIEFQLAPPASDGPPASAAAAQPAAGDLQPVDPPAGDLIPLPPTSDGSAVDAIGAAPPTGGWPATAYADVLGLETIAQQVGGEQDNQQEETSPFYTPSDCGFQPCLDLWPSDGSSLGTTDQWLPVPCPAPHGKCHQGKEPGQWLCDDVFCDVHGQQTRTNRAALRFGWWGVSTDGDLTKVGEYQDLDSSPFWDFDTLYSDGRSTLGLYGTGTDLEGTQAGLHYFGPSVQVDADFQRYFRRRDHVPLTNFDGATDFADQDLNVGEDYAIRVEELEASAETYLTRNIKFGVDVWGMRKFGERQANGMAHCFTIAPGPTTACHVLSQRQRIDWLTMEITPRVEARWGRVTVEYSRPMRSFSQDDQVVVRDYTNDFAVPIMFAGTFPYGIVPDNYTEMDRLKLGWDISSHTRLYGLAYYGRTTNKFRDVSRGFGGYDLRLTSHCFDGLTLTGYAKLYDQNGHRPPFLLPDETQNLTAQQAQERLRDPVEYRRNTAGLKGRWRPWRSHPLFGSLALTGGYEYDQLERRFALAHSVEGNFDFVQPDTVTHTFHVGAKTRWTYGLDTYARYKVLFVEDPLYGFREGNAFANSSLPEERHLIEIGGNWSPCQNLMLSGHFEIDTRRHFASLPAAPAAIVDFDEDSYPVTLTLWYAPVEKLSLTAGLAFLTNWIDQDITLGDEYLVPLAPITRRWNYSGQSSVISLKADYACSPTLKLLGGYEFVRAHNSFSGAPIADVWPDLPLLSDVIVQTQRLTAGLDWAPYARTGFYLRYIFFDYEDESVGFNSGTAHMALAGMTLIR